MSSKVESNNKTAWELQSNMLDLMDLVKHVEQVTLPDAIEQKLTGFQRKYLARCLTQLGESIENCLTQIHAY